MFGTKLKALRESDEISQINFARILGFSQSSVAAWENGTREPSIATLIEIAQYFNVSVDYLIDSPAITKKAQKEKTAPLPQDEQELLDIYQVLSPAHRAQILEYARYFAEKSGALSKSRRKA